MSLVPTHQLDALRDTVRDWHRAGMRVGLVPTMGNLHTGHFSLVELARRHADRVVVTVFVNPTQFGPNEDYARYPRTLEQDRAGLEAHGCDLLFAPDVATVYPFGLDAAVKVEVPEVSAPLEGALRPGHFVGVATVVSKLFHFVQPDVAVFGQKDYQQLLVIRRLVAEQGFPIEIVAAPTRREASGLAMSSRNQYLSPAERERAAALYRELQGIRQAVRAGVEPALAAAQAVSALENEGFRVDYVAVRRAADLSEPAASERQGLIALVAARLGATRLIDNLALDG